ncbi:hypothetical protein AY601_4068 [Pedobacter cryoconitis]|uniref:Uncharacterized protein n=1 Tax=Pedobacter cryoconitis TaxID=188932 RepID=A0A127VJ34_9SPHI|nr:hypothetical protein [Pedobacter cryoconitis]AMQ00919.1 hypothetical protein AY601_4068 [Pedobacter cryoconitis]
MKGRSVFTSKEATEIKKYLNELRSVGRDTQKDIRAHLRSFYKFYITDFTSSTSGFTVEDFDFYVERNQITVKD